jgi:adenylate cyclase
MIGRLFRRGSEKKAAGGKSWLRRVFTMDRLMGIGLLVVFLGVFYFDQNHPTQLESLRSAIFDQYQRWKPREIPPPPKQIKTLRDLRVAIVDLDENSLSEVGQWPWPRSTIARMVANIFNAGAVVVAFDIVFAEPDRMNPSAVAEALYGLDEETKRKLERLTGNDALLAQIFKKAGRVVVGQASFWEEREIDAVVGPPVRKSVAYRNLSPTLAKRWKGLELRERIKAERRFMHGFLPSFKSMVRNIPELEKAAAGHGLFSLLPEEDGIVRRVPAVFQYGGHEYPTLSLEILRVASRRSTTVLYYNEAGIASIGLPGLKVPTDRNGRIYPYFSYSDKSKYIPARDVLAGTMANPKALLGKLVLIGTSAVGLLDIRATPTERVLPGVEVHAQLIEAVLSDQYLTRPNYIAGAEFLLVFFVGFLMIWLVPRIGAKWTIVLFVLVAGGTMGTSWYMFAEKRVLVDPGYPVISTLFLYLSLTVSGFVREEAQRRQTRSAFSKYLSPAMVERVAQDPGELKLGGDKRDLTLLFCDVRGFTTISEQFDAVGLTALINKLLTPLTNVILNRQGTVDKYMGDCIMAFWNAPMDDEQHARNGCISALEMLAEMDPLNERLEAEAKEEGRKHIPLRVGFGLNSGECVVGNMGSDQRFDYSVLGDTVNTAARLEGQSKSYGVNIVIGENTYAEVSDLAVIELDLIQVKGKTEAVHIYALLGDGEMAQGNAYRALNGANEEMLAAYRGQEWQKAREKIGACRESMDGFDLGVLYDLYEERITEYEANPPGPDWDGVFVATTK